MLHISNLLKRGKFRYAEDSTIVELLYLKARASGEQIQSLMEATIALMDLSLKAVSLTAAMQAWSIPM